LLKLSWKSPLFDAVADDLRFTNPLTTLKQQTRIRLSRRFPNFTCTQPAELDLIQVALFSASSGNRGACVAGHWSRQGQQGGETDLGAKSDSAF